MHYFIVILATLTCLINGPAQANPEPTTHEYTLKNGLKLLVKANHRSPVVVSQVWYKVGSAYEPGGITGISHALEHMMFKGTPTVSGQQLTETITQQGGIFNAATTFDHTHYYEILAAERLSTSFQLEADRMQNLKLTAEDFAKEMQVVMEERRLRTDDNPQATAFERLYAAAHIATPYQHAPIGWMSDLKQMTIEDLRNWYHSWYAPNNATLVVVGDVVPEQVHQLAERYFAAMPAKTIPQLKKQEEPPALGARSVTVNRSAKLPFLALAYNVPSLTTSHENWEPYALEVLAAALDADQSARLAKNIVRGQQLAVQANAGYSPYQRFSTLFLLTATPAGKHSLADVKQGLIQQLKDLQAKPLSAQELAKLKTLLTANYTYAQDDLTAQAEALGTLASICLPWQLADQYITNIQAVTAAQVQEVAKRYLTDNNSTTLTLIPTQEAKP